MRDETDTFDVDVVFQCATDRAVCVRESDDGCDIWIPRSLIVHASPRIASLDRGDLMSIEAPVWLLEREGLICAMPSRHRSAPTGDLPDALRTWCDWIWRYADLAIRATPDARTPEGAPATWLDMMGQARERPLLEAAMRAGVWAPPEEEDIFA